MLPSMRWGSSTPDMLTATSVDPSGARLYAIVEALPGGGWDWAVWTDDHTRRCLHGTCAADGAAVDAAEQAALMLCRVMVFPEVA